MRNGNWAWLELSEKALFRCATWLVRCRGKISNSKLIAKVIAIAVKLLQTPRSRIANLGRLRAEKALEAYESRGVFGWAPKLREWLNESKFILYLGVLEMNIR